LYHRTVRPGDSPLSFVHFMSSYSSSSVARSTSIIFDCFIRLIIFVVRLLVSRPHIRHCRYLFLRQYLPTSISFVALRSCSDPWECWLFSFEFAVRCRLGGNCLHFISWTSIREFLFLLQYNSTPTQFVQVNHVLRHHIHYWFFFPAWQDSRLVLWVGSCICGRVSWQDLVELAVGWMFIVGVSSPFISPLLCHVFCILYIPCTIYHVIILLFQYDCLHTYTSSCA
jgi:hypothetical protein